MLHIEIIAAETSDDRALAALAGWLRGDPDVRRHAMVTQRTEAVDIVLTHPGAVGDVLNAYAGWRRSRWDDPVVTARVRGVPVRMTGAGPEVAAWIEALLTVDVDEFLRTGRTGLPTAPA